VYTAALEPSYPWESGSVSTRSHRKPRDVSVIYYDSGKSPCACFADGIAIATLATLGQRFLHPPLPALDIFGKLTGDP
jgi:hypothetical protein